MRAWLLAKSLSGGLSERSPERWLPGIDFGLADLKVTFEDLFSAFVGSLLCIVAWRLIRKRARQKT
jgi:hypothetical protein